MPVTMKEMEKVNGGAEPMILRQQVTYYDANGNMYTTTITAQEIRDPLIISQSASYSDGNGHQYTAGINH